MKVEAKLNALGTIGLPNSVQGLTFKWISIRPWCCTAWKIAESCFDFDTNANRWLCLHKFFP